MLCSVVLEEGRREQAVAMSADFADRSLLLLQQWQEFVLEPVAVGRASGIALWMERTAPVRGHGPLHTGP